MNRPFPSERTHYAWVIAACCTLLMFALAGIAISIPAIFLKAVPEQFGVSRTAFTMYSVFSAFTGFLAAPRAAAFYRRFGMKRVMLFCLALCSACVAGYGACRRITDFYVLAAIYGLGSAMASTIPVSMLLVNWFQEKRGLAMSLAFSGSSLGNLMAVQVFTRFLQDYGWRAAFFAMGLAIALITIPVTWFLVCERPEERGIKAYGQECRVWAFDGEAGPPGLGITRKSFCKTSAFWNVITASFLFPTVIMGLQNNLSAYLTDRGMSLPLATEMLSILIMSQFIGKFIFGPMLDRLGTGKSVIYIGTCYIFGMLLLLTAGDRTGQVALSVILIGLAGPAVTIFPPYLTAEIAGQHEYGEMIGRVHAAVQMGSSCNAAITAFFYDYCGGYHVGWILYVVLMFVSCVLCVRGSKKRQGFHYYQ